MPVSFASLPTSDTVSNWVQDLIVKSGLLRSQPSFLEAAKIAWETIVVPALEAGELSIVRVGEEKWILNHSSKMSRDHRICMSPRTVRHGWGVSKSNLDLPPAYAEEQESRSQIQWTVNRRMLDLIKVAAQQPEFKKVHGTFPALAVAEDFCRQADAGGQDWFHICPFFDEVGREYGEGLLTYTGSQLVRYLIEPLIKLPYDAELTARCSDLIFPISGISLLNWREVLAKANDFILGCEDPWMALRHAIFFEECVLQGQSSCMVSFDFRTMGAMTTGVAARDRNMLTDCNLLLEDGRDCRNTVRSLVSVPSVLKSHSVQCLAKETAKPFITQTIYGQGPRGATAGLIWKDDKKAPDAWLDSLGFVNLPLMEKIQKTQPNLLNKDWMPVIQDLGWNAGYQGLYNLSSEYYNAFWKAYKDLQIFVKKVEKAADAFQVRTGQKPEMTNYLGWTYHHHKWVMQKGGTTTRLRYKGVGAPEFPHGFDVSMGEMEDVASAYSFSVRTAHQADAMMRCDISRRIKIQQTKQFGEYVGHAAIHDAFLVPMAFAFEFKNRVARPAMHNFVEKFPSMMDKFLTDNGQEPMRQLSKAEDDTLHIAISMHDAWMNV